MFVAHQFTSTLSIADWDSGSKKKTTTNLPLPSSQSLYANYLVISKVLLQPFKSPALHIEWRMYIPVHVYMHVLAQLVGGPPFSQPFTALT